MCCNSKIILTKNGAGPSASHDRVRQVQLWTVPIPRAPERSQDKGGCIKITRCPVAQSKCQAHFRLARRICLKDSQEVPAGVGVGRGFIAIAAVEEEETSFVVSK